MKAYWLTSEDSLFRECYHLRVEVFVREQGFQDEFDDIDRTATHLLFRKDALAVATARVFPEGEGVFHVGRICVKAEMREQGIGRRLLEEVERYCTERQGRLLVLGAQMRAAGFYESCGFIRFGEEFLDEGYPHIMMRKELKKDAPL